MLDWRRLVRHLLTGERQARRLFPARSLEAIERSIRECEGRHSGEIRFAVEAALDPDQVRSGMTPRERASEMFAQLRVWDTEGNNGVLIYLLLADHAVEIVADRGVAAGRVPQSEWDAACRRMEENFRAGRFEQGAVAGVEAVADILARHPPGPPRSGNQLPDEPVIIR
jgi:uncharacterized membrane protein